MFVITVNEQQKAIIQASLDLMVRNLAGQLSQQGIDASHDAVIKIIEVRNTAVVVAESKPPAPPEEKSGKDSGESEKQAE